MDLLLHTTGLMIVFSFIASGIYIFNDLHDLSYDQQHPIKKKRPLAHGDVSKRLALLLLTLFLGGGLTLVFFFFMPAFYFVLGYILLNIAYTLRLKRIAILDVGIIALGFVIRLAIGAVIGHIFLSYWIIMMVFLLALFLGFSKRRDDCLIMIKSAQKMRASMEGYTLQFLDYSMVMTATVTLVTYILYTTSESVQVKWHENSFLYITALPVLFAILRYMQRTFIEEDTCSPTRILLTDFFIQGCILTWILLFLRLCTDKP